MVLGGILVATLAAGCFDGGGGPGYGYSSSPYGYSSNYYSYGSSYPYSGYRSGYSNRGSYGNSYAVGNRNEVRADDHRAVSRDRVTTAHASVARSDSRDSDRSVKN